MGVNICSLQALLDPLYCPPNGPTCLPKMSFLLHGPRYSPFDTLDLATRHKLAHCALAGLDFVSQWSQPLAAHQNHLGNFKKDQDLDPTLEQLNQRLWKGPVIFP